MKQVIELNRDGTLPVRPRKEPEITATIFHFPEIVIRTKEIPNPKWRWWKFWERKTIVEWL